MHEPFDQEHQLDRTDLTHQVPKVKVDYLDSL